MTLPSDGKWPSRVTGSGPRLTSPGIKSASQGELRRYGGGSSVSTASRQRSRAAHPGKGGGVSSVISVAGQTARIRPSAQGDVGDLLVLEDNWCRFLHCKFHHVCSACGEPHLVVACPRGAGPCEQQNTPLQRSSMAKQARREAPHPY